jgi:hypothetical protein
MRLIGGLGLLVAGTLISGPAFADPTQSQGGQTYPSCTKAVSPSESDLAHQKYIAGKQDYDEANYDSAIRRFRDAYALDCTKHELLVVIATAYERKGDKKEAVNALDTYVARAPSAPDVGSYQTKIEKLKKQIAATPPPPPPASAPPPLPREAEVRRHSALPWVVVGVGAAAIASGIVIVLTTPSLPDGCSKTTRDCKRLTPGETDESLQNRKEDAGKALDQPLVGYIVVGAGAAVAAGGLLWHFLEPTGSKESAKTKLRPSFAPGYAGLSVGGSF